MERELETACRLAREAGKLILKFYYNDGTHVEWKTPTEPVTLADKAANRFIVDSLRHEFPDDGILAEESPDTEGRLHCSRVWVIDPLDGTKEYIKRNGEFSVMIGLAIDGEPVVGAVYQPTTDILYYASKGNGSFVVKDGATNRAMVSAIEDPAEMCLIVSRSHKDPYIEEIRNRLGITREKRSGSVGLKVGQIIEQDCDLYIHISNKTRQWDACAPDIILREAGGKFTDLSGQPFVYNRPDSRNLNGLVASNGAIHDEIIDVAQEVIVLSNS
ncbi:MAG TPA: 3'(2'),5'-bisphosphate nucleotidase CysQ [Blastocatellia bacterium]|nr:3'(2'),5'-bisphosphate nucleotidase CysQ [Blastocatellia bacterium]